MHRAHAGRTAIVNSEWSDIVVKGPAHHIVSIEDAPVVPGLVSYQYDEETPDAKKAGPQDRPTSVAAFALRASARQAVQYVHHHSSVNETYINRPSR